LPAAQGWGHWPAQAQKNWLRNGLKSPADSAVPAMLHCNKLQLNLRCFLAKSMVKSSFTSFC
jgi:hypothetical protein